MNRYDAATYGDRIAADYDALHAHLDPGDAVALLAELARGGRALELGVGTGRVAIPLAARGVEVHGVDSSAAMLARLAAKPGGDAVKVTAGDFVDALPDGPFDVAYVPFNTFFALQTQDDQVRCFRNVAQRLAPGGCFVLEAFVPDPSRFARGQATQTLGAGVAQVHLEASRHDPVAQRIASAHVVLAADGPRIFPVALRYAWPSELDLMARLAGLTLRERWTTWGRAPFTAASGQHVSVYARPEALA